MSDYATFDCPNPECGNTLRVKAEKLVDKNANIQCTECGLKVDNTEAAESYNKAINDLKKSIKRMKF